MKLALYTLCLLLLAIPQLSPAATSFEERIKAAEEMENDPKIKPYSEKEFFPKIGPALSTSMRMCVDLPNADKNRFTIVFDITALGKLSNVEVEPRSNTALCIASILPTIQAPKPPICSDCILPIVLKTNITNAH